MSDYTPESEDVRGYFALAHEERNAVPEGTGEAGFDRWLAAHDAAIRADEREKAAQRLLDAWDTYVPMSVVGAGYGPWLDRMLAAARGEDTPGT